MSFLATNAVILLVHRDMPQVSEAKVYDLMLTPQFYISKREALPVKYLFQAIKLAPSILDDLTTSSNEYSYTAIKDGDEWVLIAYDVDEIVSFVEGRGIPKSSIGKIYFAQQAKEYFQTAVEVDQKSAIVTIDDAVVMLPKEFIKAQSFARFLQDARPAKGITLRSSSSSNVVGQMQAIVISLLLLILSAEYIAEALRYGQSLSLLEEKMQSIKGRYPTLENKSSLVLNSLYKSSHAIDQKQRKIRDRLKDISSLTSKDSKLDSIKIDQKSYEAVISTDKKTIKRLLKYAKSKNLTVKSAKSTFVLKGAL